MRRRHMLGTEDKTLCGWPLTTGELKQLRSVSTIHVTCKRCLEKLDSYSDNKHIKQKGNILNG
ncbi:MAG: hypothetical protein P8R32_02585 [Candidatus Poseidoniia archaeon]|nr:hypothetical protein [Candidatus Poseidoniia archaeon]